LESVGGRVGGVWSSLETRFRSRKWNSPHEENKEQEQEQLAATAATEANTTERTYDNSVFFFFFPSVFGCFGFVLIHYGMLAEFERANK
jgi:hypothetical protein